jgi:hypothetical protein
LLLLVLLLLSRPLSSQVVPECAAVAALRLPTAVACSTAAMPEDAELRSLRLPALLLLLICGLSGTTACPMPLLVLLLMLLLRQIDPVLLALMLDLRFFLLRPRAAAAVLCCSCCRVQGAGCSLYCCNTFFDLPTLFC